MILFDNGHGENTPGKRSPDGVFREYLFTREIAQEAERELRKRGYECERIIKCAMDVSLSQRVKIVNEYCAEYGAKNVVLFSIHVNAAGEGSKWMDGRGFEVYTSPGNTKSDTLAELVYDEAKVQMPGMKMRTDLTDGDHDKEARFTMLTQTKCPAVLIENFFMDNREDLAYLQSPEGKKAIVKTIVNAAIKYADKYIK